MSGEEACGRTFRSGSGRYYDCERATGHGGRHSAFPDVAPPAPAPGGRKRDAREQIARAMHASDNSGTWDPLWEELPDGPDLGQRYYYRLADAVLACPAVADALAAVERVRAVTNALDTTAAEAEAEDRRPLIDARVIVEQLHVALDGPP